MKDQTHILVAAREPEWRKFAVQVLVEAGYRVQLGSNMPAALQEITRNDFDLIIIDALLLDLLKVLAKEYVETRLLVVTVVPSVFEAITAYRYGALDYMSKTFDAASLLATVAAVLQKQPVPSLI